ncbi:uncharacterized protein TNCV_1261931 [Trichonephila clavipes]|nr:uncharacterized protein TNCV_1261931 [Trichonephila clavipes]
MAEGSEDQKRIIEEKDKLIKRQFIRIEELESELTALKEERDALLCDVNKLRFELEMSELKRLKDVRSSFRLEKPYYRRRNVHPRFAGAPRALGCPVLWAAAVAEWYRYRIVACLVTSSSPVPLKTRRVGQRCTLNLSRAETSSRWCGVVVRRGRCQLRCRPRHLTMVQNYVVRRTKALL